MTLEQGMIIKNAVMDAVAFVMGIKVNTIDVDDNLSDRHGVTVSSFSIILDDVQTTLSKDIGYINISPDVTIRDLLKEIRKCYS